MPQALDKLPDIATARLRIAPLADTDAQALQRLTDEPSITEAVDFLPTPFTLADAEALLARCDADNGFLGVWRARDLAGVVGIHRHAGPRLEIGYWFGAAYRGHGYAREAAGAVLDMLADTSPAAALTAECRPENAASWRLLLQLGFVDSGQPGHRAGRRRLARA